MNTTTDIEEDDRSEHSDHNSNGLVGKLTKVSPFIILAVGLGGGFVTNYVTNSVQQAKQDQAILQMQLVQTKLIQDIEQLRAEVVPRREHEEMLNDNKVIAHWIEKYNDSMHINLQHEIDELKRSCNK